MWWGIDTEGKSSVVVGLVRVLLGLVVLLDGVVRVLTIGFIRVLKDITIVQKPAF